jgi:hypothetical protein
VPQLERLALLPVAHKVEHPVEHPAVAEVVRTLAQVADVAVLPQFPLVPSCAALTVSRISPVTGPLQQRPISIRGVA